MVLSQRNVVDVDGIGLMGRTVGFLIIAAFLSPVAIGQNSEPTKEEIAEAYRAKSGEGGTFIPGVRWERWRIKEIRGSKLHFNQTSEKRSPGVTTLNYEVVAKKNGSCAEYRITDTMSPLNSQIKPILVVDPNGVKACR